MKFNDPLEACEATSPDGPCEATVLGKHMVVRSRGDRWSCLRCGETFRHVEFVSPSKEEDLPEKI